MKNFILLFTIVFFSFHFSFSQYNMEEGYIKTVSEDQAKTSFTFKNLRIYPLIAGDKFKDSHKDLGKYTSLKEALENKKISITETESGTVNTEVNVNNVIDNNDLDNNVNTNVNIQQNNNQQINTNQIQQINVGNGAQVNKLFIQNVSKDTIYIMAGEVVKGGKQDRVLAQDMILPPGGDKVDISVFCVERNRWSYNSNGSEGKFDKYFSVSSNNVRKKVIQDKNQSAVWEEVGKTVKKNNTETNTGTYTSLVNSEEYNTELKAYVDFFKNELSKNPNCIGFVGVSGDKIIGCDIFATPELFEKQKETILKGYITEAIIHGSDVKVGYDKVSKYLTQLLTTHQNEQDEIINKIGGQYKHNNKQIHITTF